MNRIKIGTKKSTREEIGAVNIEPNGVETNKNDFLVYFLVQPDNIAVLSETAVRTKIIALSGVIKGYDCIEFSCINSRENFDSNKNFYKERLEKEHSQKVRELLEKDIAHLDRVQIQTASAREFLFILRFKNYNFESNDVQTGISRMEKLLKDEGFTSRLAAKDDIKRLYAVYYVQNITQIYFDNYDGERFVRSDDYI
ncbi:hypothetical protein [Anaerotignum lactatifermentans]|uniref:Uncharacterized protein n=1 Tax=Anaerotignum lactatifermentans DSM 14214 TaxID=1121323 RepID=A0A1M6LCQ5_9FIRM|nr:hypothetical protein [Anaerotignum lactatifermentans]SHJ68954.1 hypothetical protein SAMN02745138_00344 [[Clostridium] lactatifermentans DSM 14214] [Anaerotignum lactatifermentans DSM 14214]